MAFWRLAVLDPPKPFFFPFSGHLKMVGGVFKGKAFFAREVCGLVVGWASLLQLQKVRGGKLLEVQLRCSAELNDGAPGSDRYTEQKERSTPTTQISALHRYG